MASGKDWTWWDHLSTSHSGHMGGDKATESKASTRFFHLSQSPEQEQGPLRALAWPGHSRTSLPGALPACCLQAHLCGKWG